MERINPGEPGNKKLPNNAAVSLEPIGVYVAHNEATEYEKHINPEPASGSERVRDPEVERHPFRCLEVAKQDKERCEASQSR
jgi:hypothetical protein